MNGWCPYLVGAASVHTVPYCAVLSLFSPRICLLFWTAGAIRLEQADHCAAESLSEMQIHTPQR